MEGLPEIPRPYKVITGDQHLILECTETFFNGILDFLSYSDRAREAFVERETKALGREYPDGFIPTDDQITLLIVRDTTVVSVLERRDELNWIEVLSAHYLTPERIKSVRQGIIEY